MADVRLTIPASNFAPTLVQNQRTWTDQTANEYRQAYGGDRYTLSITWRPLRETADNAQPLQRHSRLPTIMAELSASAKAENSTLIDLAAILGYKRSTGPDLPWEVTESYGIGVSEVRVSASFTDEQAGVISAGDFISINNEIKLVTQGTIAVHGGRPAPIQFEPALRKPVAAGTPIETDAPTGRFRLTTPPPTNVQGRLGATPGNNWRGEISASFVEFDEIDPVEIEAVLEQGTAPAPPTARFSASPTSAKEGQTVTLRVTGSDPQDAPLSYEWSGSPAVTFSDPDGAETTFTMPASDVEVTLTEWKQADPDARASYSLTITLLSNAPADPKNVTLTEESDGVLFMDWDDDDAVDTWEVQLRRAGTAWGALRTPAVSELRAAGNAPGSYQGRVRGVNDFGASAWVTANATVTGSVNRPATPSNLRVSGGAGSIQADVDPQSDADSFNWRYKLTSVTQWQPTITSTGPSRTITGLATGTYDVQCQAVNTAGASAWTLARQATVTTPATAPDEPTGMRAITFPDRITLYWNTQADAATYETRLRVGTGAWSNRTGITQGFQTYDGLPSNTQHEAQVRARNAQGASDWASFPADQTITKERPPPQPAVPTGLAVSMVATGANLTWDDSADADNWAIRYKPTGFTRWGGAITTRQMNSYSVMRLTPGIEYEFQVRAGTIAVPGVAHRTSDWSASVTGTVPVAPSAPDAPASVSMASITHNSARAEVPQGGGRAQFRIREAGGAWSQTRVTNDNDWGFTALDASTDYEVQARHVNGSLSSAWVTTNFETLPAPVAPSAVRTLSVTSSGGVSTLTWLPPSRGAFDIYYWSLRIISGRGPGGERVSLGTFSATRQDGSHRTTKRLRTSDGLIVGERYRVFIRPRGGPISSTEFVHA